MAKRHKKALTQRERECRKIAREKALRKQLQAWWLRLRIALAAVTVALLLAALTWEYAAGGISRAGARALDGVYAFTGKAGFAVSAMYLEGRARTPLAAVKQALAIERGAPIFGLSLPDIRARLEQLPTVKHAYVERVLPGTVHITLLERRPVAVWQQSGKLKLIDDEGAAMDDLALQDFNALPLVIGDGAPQHVQEALALLAQAKPDAAQEVEALVRVGERRWNIRLKNGVEVKLPEDNAAAAWAAFLTAAKEKQLLTQPIRSVDLRLSGKMILRLAPPGNNNASPPGNNNASPSGNNNASPPGAAAGAPSRET